MSESILEEGLFGEIDCADPVISGVPSTRFDFVPKHHKEDILDDVDLDLKPRCEPWYYYNMKVGNLLALENVNATGVNATGEITSNGGGHVLSSKKNFDISHPAKQNWRLRHTCLEGPENGVYFRGCVKLYRDKVHVFVRFPDYWNNFVDSNTLTVHLSCTMVPLVLTYSLESNGFYIKGLPISHLSWSNKNEYTKINYFVVAQRNDGEKLIPEYEGETPNDYPGNNLEYSISGYHYDIKNG